MTRASAVFAKFLTRFAPIAVADYRDANDQRIRFMTQDCDHSFSNSYISISVAPRSNFFRLSKT